MMLIDTLDDLERVFKMMREYDVAECVVDGIEIRTRQKMPDMKAEGKKVTDADILLDPYAGLNS